MVEPLKWRPLVADSLITLEAYWCENNNKNNSKNYSIMLSPKIAFRGLETEFQALNSYTAVCSCEEGGW